MNLHDVKSHYQHLGYESPPLLARPDETGNLLSVILIQQTANSGFISNFEFKSSSQVKAAVSKAWRMLTMLNRNLSQKPQEVFIPTNSALIRSRFQCRVQPISPILVRDMQI